jgi:hypothetical protein
MEKAYYLYYIGYKLVRRGNPNNPTPDVGGVYFVTLLLMFNIITCLAIIQLRLEINCNSFPIYLILGTVCGGFNYYYLIHKGKGEKIIQYFEKKSSSSGNRLRLFFVFFTLRLLLLV